VLDPRSCVAYLTIEHAGPFDEPLREGVGAHVFGCDVCQEACPFNRTQPPPEHETAPFAPQELWRGSLETLLSMTEEAWRGAVLGSPLRRASAARMIRNAVTALANEGDTRHLAAIEALASSHPDEGVRSHAAWAAGKLRGIEAGDVQRGTGAG
jgi:epoxyqueuosine reductase